MLDVPVGVIVTCWGGTPVEAWMDRETMGGFKEFDLSFLDGDGKIDRPQNKPLRTLQRHDRTARAFTVKGFLWYQGESNRLRPGQYRALMPAFVKMLRERWAQGELPFYYVQIAPYCYEKPRRNGLGPAARGPVAQPRRHPVERHGRDDGHRRRELHPPRPERGGRHTPGMAGADENLRHEGHRRRHAGL